MQFAGHVGALVFAHRLEMPRQLGQAGGTALHLGFQPRALLAGFAVLAFDLPQEQQQAHQRGERQQANADAAGQQGVVNRHARDLLHGGGFLQMQVDQFAQFSDFCVGLVVVDRLAGRAQVAGACQCQ